MAVWTIEKLGCIPRGLAVIYCFGALIVYVIAVHREDVSPYVPFISETGAKPPESGLFALTVFATGLHGMAAVALRYAIIQDYNQPSSIWLAVGSKLSLAFGLVAMLGMIVCGAFPVLDEPVTHDVAALTLFLGSAVYGVLDTSISYKMVPKYLAKATFLTRVIIMIVSFLVMLCIVIVVPIGIEVRRILVPPNTQEWTGYKRPGSKGFANILIGSIGEWTLSFLFVAYFLTYVAEFKGLTLRISLERTPAKLLDEEDLPEDVNSEKSEND